MDLCKRHNRVRCGECSYIEQLEEENKLIKNTLANVHFSLLEANEAYCNNEDFKVNYKVNVAIVEIEELAIKI